MELRGKDGVLSGVLSSVPRDVLSIRDRHIDKQRYRPLYIHLSTARESRGTRFLLSDVQQIHSGEWPSDIFTLGFLTVRNLGQGSGLPMFTNLIAP